LSCGRNAQFELARQAGHVDLAAQRSLRETNRHFAHHVLADSAKKRVTADLDHELQIARRFVDAHAIARLAHGSRCAVLDAGRNFDGQRALALGQALTAADSTRREHHLSGAAAARARPFDRNRK